MGYPIFPEYGTWLAQGFGLARRDINGDCAFNSITLADSSALLTSLGIAGTAAQDGYVTLSVGADTVLICWGREASVSGLSGSTFAFPVAFNGVNDYSIIACYHNNSAVGNACAAHNVSASQGRVFNSTAVSQDIFWIAAGKL